jgi:hypothetical protein
MQGNLVVETGGQMHRRERELLTFAGGGQGQDPPRVVEPMMMMIMITSILFSNKFL